VESASPVILRSFIWCLSLQAGMMGQPPLPGAFPTTVLGKARASIVMRGAEDRVGDQLLYRAAPEPLYKQER
jgi:hypothetical protein